MKNDQVTLLSYAQNAATNADRTQKGIWTHLNKAIVETLDRDRDEAHGHRKVCDGDKE